MIPHTSIPESILTDQTLLSYRGLRTYGRRTLCFQVVQHERRRQRTATKEAISRTGEDQRLSVSLSDLESSVLLGPLITKSLSRLSKLAIKPWLESAPKGVVFINARVVDPANSTLLDGLQTIVIRDGKIHAVESVKSKAISADSRVAALPQVDLDGAYICP